MNDQQQHILIYLYRFRFLNRNQIQQLLHHKYFNRIIIWLNQLTKDNYIKRYYNPKTVTIPAYYSLDSKGRKHLLDHQKVTQVKSKVLDRVWREHRYTKQLKEHCLFLADVYVSLVAQTGKAGAILDFKTKTDLFGMQYLILPNPDAYFSITEKNGSKKRYFLDIFDDQPARAALFNRVKQYFDYYDGGYWQDHTEVPFPAIILIAPDDQSKNYLRKQIQTRMDGEPTMSFFLTTREKGLSKETLEKVTEKI